MVTLAFVSSWWCRVSLTVGADGRSVAGAVPWLIAQTEKRQLLPIERLDPVTRTKALAALTALIILMFGMMLLASLGARWARNYANRPPVLFEDRKKKRSGWDADDWATKPLHSADDEAADDRSPPEPG